jgi:cytochrome c
MNSSFGVQVLVTVVAVGSWAVPSAAGDAALGEQVFRARCSQCHEIATNENKTGPTLKGLIGRTSGTIEGFAYSDAMKAAGVVWSEETLRTYLTNPRAMIPKIKMAFNGLKRPGEMDDIIAYLLENAG